MINLPIFFRQGKLTTHKEELYPKNPYLQNCLSAEVRAAKLNFLNQCYNQSAFTGAENKEDFNHLKLL